ncbi:MAG: hypothetical protein HN544_07460, partial [Euryarchaeota archaeon]|nr:hypothetical protein [Euryarchaeota archaeon]
EETKPAKATAKKAIAKKAVAKKATPKAAVAKKATPKAVDKKPKKEKTERIRPTGLPEGFELSGTMPRYIGWLINFAWNFGALIGTLSIFAFGDPDLTIPFIGAALMIIINWLVIPIWLGRNIGEFVARTKYINSSGNKPNPVHAVMNNSLGFMFLIGFILVAVNLSDISSSSGKTWVGIGFLLVIVWVVNYFLKKNSDYSQGMFDLMFSAYSVNHVSTGSETGWLAKFEGLGDLGDKFEKRQESRREKASKKADAKEASSKDKSKDSEDDEKKAEEEPSDSED